MSNNYDHRSPSPHSWRALSDAESNAHLRSHSHRRHSLSDTARGRRSSILSDTSTLHGSRAPSVLSRASTGQLTYAEEWAESGQREQYMNQYPQPARKYGEDRIPYDRWVEEQGTQPEPPDDWEREQSSINYQNMVRDNAAWAAAHPVFDVDVDVRDRALSHSPEPSLSPPSPPPAPAPVLRSSSPPPPPAVPSRPAIPPALPPRSFARRTALEEQGSLARLRENGIREGQLVRAQATARRARRVLEEQDEQRRARQRLETRNRERTLEEERERLGRTRRLDSLGNRNEREEHFATPSQRTKARYQI